jgi:hypothetical protein
MTYRTTIRKQFIFVVNNQKLACLLTLNTSNPDHLINIVAITVQKLENNIENYVRIVIGPNKFVTHNNSEYEGQLEQFISYLEFLKIDYYQNNIIQILNAGTCNFYRIIFVALYCAGIPVRSYYLGEPLTDEMLSAIVDVPQRYINVAIETIKNINIIDPESSLYINHANIDDKCQIINNGNIIFSDELN